MAEAEKRRVGSFTTAEIVEHHVRNFIASRIPPALLDDESGVKLWKAIVDG